MSTTDSDTKETSQETPKKEEEYKIEVLPEDYPQSPIPNPQRIYHVFKYLIYF